METGASGRGEETEHGEREEISNEEENSQANSVGRSGNEEVEEKEKGATGADKQEEKIFLMFPCCHRCLKNEMNRIYNLMPGHVSVSGNTITIDDHKLIFFLDTNSHPQDVYGLEIDGYKACKNYNLSREVIEYLNSHMR